MLLRDFRPCSNILIAPVTPVAVHYIVSLAPELKKKQNDSVKKDISILIHHACSSLLYTRQCRQRRRQRHHLDRQGREGGI